MKKSFEKSYTTEVHARIGYLASWLPTASVALGDVGVMEGRQFETQTTLSALGVEFTTSVDDAKASFGFVSDGAVSAKAAGKAAGDPFGGAPGLAAAADLAFSRDRAVFFRVENALTHRIASLDAVKSEVLRLNAQAKWERKWLVVTQVVQAERCLVLVSADRSASATLALKAAMPPATAQEIASGRAEVGLSSSVGLEFEFEIGELCTPLYQAFKVKSGLVRAARTERSGPDGYLLPAGTREFDFVPFEYDDDTP